MSDDNRTFCGTETFHDFMVKAPNTIR